MLVSAISANVLNSGFSAVEKSRYPNIRGLEVPDSESCENCPPNFGNGKTALNTIYDDINMWKHFCCKQIALGKLDIIA